MTTQKKVSESEVFTRSEAATLCAVSEDTIKRDLRADKYPNAKMVTCGKLERWQIPAADLVAAGRLGADQVSAAREHLEDLRLVEQTRALTERVRALETELAVWQARAGERENLIAVLTSGAVVRSAAVAS